MRPTTTTRTWRDNIRNLISDTDITTHSGRHTFIEVARRAGAHMSIVEEI